MHSFALSLSLSLIHTLFLSHTQPLHVPLSLASSLCLPDRPAHLDAQEQPPPASHTPTPIARPAHLPCQTHPTAASQSQTAEEESSQPRLTPSTPPTPTTSASTPWETSTSPSSTPLQTATMPPEPIR
ncbi:unnamed protein product [Mortierella alpina]